ncbi:hypothetical protein GRI89_10130 [Altererythrobacter salegens]|uniref:Uncharacterized protein n=1 Tax=Croceibacterium salegens TaxID=1737568 RepID=A0A6I4SYN6_9SPHN|nr:hypothetical protein [Croceibacterium salegens]MXO59896.1 hypothetical protein [Croceibacterium salegens]
MLALLVAAAVSANAPQWIKDGKQPSAEDAASRMARCDVTRPNARFNDLLQEDVLAFPSDEALNGVQLTCIAQVAFDTGYEVELPESNLAAYYRSSQEISRPWTVDLAREWLEEQGKLEGLPVRDPSMTDQQFAKVLEAHCGPDAKGLLSSEFGPHSIAPSTAGANFEDFSRTAEAGLCLLASGAVEDFEIYIIGNEKVAE